MSTEETTPSPSLIAQIVALPNLGMNEIRVMWRRLFRTDVPTHNRQFLERRIAYRLQEIEFRRTDPALMDRNNRRINQLKSLGRLRKRERDVQLVPGTTIKREYRGVHYQLIVTPEGKFELNGTVFNSLSLAAYAITGTRWSGPVFFGLKAGKRTKPTKKGSAE